MNTLLSKLFNEGTGLNKVEWKEFMRLSHIKHTHMTPDLFDRFFTKEGTSSYQILADTIKSDSLSNNVDILDLGCGDGHLFKFILEKIGTGTLYGIDISEAELKTAKLFKDKRVQTRLESADSLSLSNKSIDYVLCHLSLMLMTPIDDVIKEILRVLKPNGTLSAVVINRSVGSGNYIKLQEFLFNTFKMEFPNINLTGMGETLFTSKEGITLLLSKWHDFESSIKFHEYTIHFETTPEEFYDTYKTHYLMAILPPEIDEKIKKAVTEFAKCNSDLNGMFNLEYPLNCFSVKKRHKI